VKQLRNRLTYANVMSSLAVFLVLGGATAFAATKIGANQLKANSVKTGKIVKEAVTTGKIKNNAVKTSKISNDAVTGEKVNEGTLGEVPKAALAVNAETGAPRAYARVIAGGGVDEQFTRGLTDASVTLVGGSAYCFELGFAPKNIQATVDWIGGGANTFAQATLQPFNVCPAGTDASVRTTDNGGSGIATISFYVQFVG
jgi:hypothetical protein